MPIKSLVSHFLQSHRGCCHCGAWHSSLWSLCSKCKLELAAHEYEKHVITRSYLKFPCSAAYAREGKSRSALSSLISSCKHGQNLLFFREVAFKLYLGLNQSGECDEETVLIPCPATPGEPHETDHAYVLAQELNRIAGWAIDAKALSWKSYKTQKQLAFNSRRHRSFNESGKNYTKYRCVFVDDVLTTGFTAKAAYEALGKPNLFRGVFAFHQLRNRQMQKSVLLP